ncbi:MAG: TIGR00180 family glycosyltransferase [Bacteroidetes bacterium]|nr:TIGR00180 family glycosyltransferase [Bacteroidota bacterium]
MLKGQATIIIILHNRHRNLDRLLDYYAGVEFPIVIADSSKQEHKFEHLSDSVKYIYTPGFSFTQKVEEILPAINTPYVLMCADDDFVVPSGIRACTEFLDKNNEYSCAQGMILKYYVNTHETDFRVDMLYQGDFSINTMHPWERINKLFQPYKSLLYGVHRTKVLNNVFKGAGKSFRNLYLNEYLTSIVPLFYGKYKDIEVLYQVREHSDFSDDKTVDNIDVIVQSEKYRDEYRSFLAYLNTKMGHLHVEEQDQLKKAVRLCLEMYAGHVRQIKEQGLPLKKQFGKLLLNIPGIGKTLIQKRRNSKSRASVSRYLTPKDWDELEIISGLLKKFK